MHCSRGSQFTRVPGSDARSRWLGGVLHEGDEREFDPAVLEEATVGCVLSVGPHGPVATAIKDGLLTVACVGLRASATIRPAAR